VRREDVVVNDTPRPPGVRELAAFVAVATAAGVMVFRAGLPAPWSWWVLALISAVAAAVIGLPVLVWLIEHERTGLRPLALASALAGAVPPAVALASGMLGLAARQGLDYLKWAVSQGAPIPAYGALPWTGFLRLELLAMLAGALAGAAYWTIRHNRPR
jgi:hypothetical protein